MTDQTAATVADLVIGAKINLHGHTATIQHTDPDDTMVQYTNLARRTFDTPDLAFYLEHGVFPVGTIFQRPSDQAVLAESKLGSDYQVRITGGDLSGLLTFTYTELIEWHMKGVVKVTDKPEEIDDTGEHPFETELQKEIKRLIQENNQLRQAIQSQINRHDTIIAGYEQDIKRLEAKAAILHPAPVSKEVCTLIAPLHMPEVRATADTELASRLSAGWNVLHITVNSSIDTHGEEHYRITTLTRDLPTEPAPLARATIAAADQAIYSTPYLPPVQRPPMPANQAFVNQPVSRALTHNGPKPGDTRRIPTLADLKVRHDNDNAEIEEIMQRGREAQETLRRKFAQSPRPFSSLTGAQ